MMKRWDFFHKLNIKKILREKWEEKSFLINCVLSEEFFFLFACDKANYNSTLDGKVCRFYFYFLVIFGERVEEFFICDKKSFCLMDFPNFRFEKQILKLSHIQTKFLKITPKFNLKSTLIRKFLIENFPIIFFQKKM